MPLLTVLAEQTPPTDMQTLTSTVSSVTSMLGDVVESVAGLITTFPLNIFLGLTLIGVGVGLFRKLKR